VTMKKSTLMELIELRRGRTIEELIREQTEAGWTQEQIAADLGISFYTLRSWMYRLGARVESTMRFDSDLAGSGVE
jgi:hypothetical protein